MPVEKTDPFIQHSDTLWTLTADWQETAFRRRMTVMKTASGGLVIHSAVDLPEEQWRELAAMGPVEAIVIPNFFHDSEAPSYANRFPDAVVFAPESIIEKTRSRCPRSKVLSLEQDWASSPWSKDIECIPIQGLRVVAESVFLHRESRTLVLCDMAFNMDPARFSPVERVLMRWNRIGLGFGPSRLATSFFIKDKGLAGRSFQRISALDFDRVVVNHGDIVESGGRNAFLRAFQPFIQV